MSTYRRNYVPGGTFFFTVVTAERRAILTTELGRACLRSAIATVRQRRPWQIFAFVLLPDHLHTVWILPPGDSDYPVRWRRIKEEFTRNWLASGGDEADVSASRKSKEERGVWQRRYWEHTVRDEDDLKRCVDYVHWNPKKHGYVARVADWKWSSFHRFVAAGEYHLDWGGTDPVAGFDTPE